MGVWVHIGAVMQAPAEVQHLINSPRTGMGSCVASGPLLGVGVVV